MIPDRHLDLAIVNSGIYAFEIKSEADTLERLPEQVKVYCQYFDKLTVVCAPKHIVGTLKITPDQVAVWSFDGFNFTVHRRGKKTPIRDPLRLIRLLQAGELRKLGKIGGFVSSGKRRGELVKLASNLPVTMLRSHVIKSLCDRYNKTNKAFWRRVAKRQVRPSDLSALSPYQASTKIISRIAPESHGKRVPLLKMTDDKQMQEWASLQGTAPMGEIPHFVARLIEFKRNS